MAKAKLNKKFKTYTGKLPPNDHRLYITNRFGQEVISHCPEHRDPDTITEAQRNAFQLIKQASALADADLRDPVKHDEWLYKWHEHSALCASRSPHRPKKPYKTLRGFVIAAYRAQLAVWFLLFAYGDDSIWLIIRNTIPQRAATSLPLLVFVR